MKGCAFQFHCPKLILIETTSSSSKAHLLFQRCHYFYYIVVCKFLPDDMTWWVFSAGCFRDACCLRKSATRRTWLWLSIGNGSSWQVDPGEVLPPVALWSCCFLSWGRSRVRIPIMSGLASAEKLVLGLHSFCLKKFSKRWIHFAGPVLALIVAHIH